MNMNDIYNLPVQKTLTGDDALEVFKATLESLNIVNDWDLHIPYGEDANKGISFEIVSKPHKDITRCWMVGYFTYFSTKFAVANFSGRSYDESPKFFLEDKFVFEAAVKYCKDVCECQNPIDLLQVIDPNDNSLNEMTRFNGRTLEQNLEQECE